MTRKQILELVERGKGEDVAYNPTLKDALLRLERQYLRALAPRLGLKRGEYAIRSCEGGIAVAGEAILHTDWIYVQLSQSLCIGANAMLYRTVTSRKDYCGGTNRYLQWDALLDLDQVAQTLLRLKPG